MSMPILCRCANIATMLIVPLFPGSITSKICLTIQFGRIVPVWALVKAANSEGSTTPLPFGSIKWIISSASIPDDLSQLSMSSTPLIRWLTLPSAFFASSFFVAIATPVAVIAPPVATVASATLSILVAASESLILPTILSRFEVFIPRLVERDFNSFVLKESRLPLLFCKADMTSGGIFICSGIPLALALIDLASKSSIQPHWPFSSSAQMSPFKGFLLPSSG